MLENLQALIDHDAVGIGIFLAIVGYAIALNMPREWQCSLGWGLSTATIAPAALVVAAVFALPMLLMPTLFLLGIACATRR